MGSTEEIINLAKGFAKEMKNGFEKISPKIWSIFKGVAMANAICYLFASFFSIAVCLFFFIYGIKVYGGQESDACGVFIVLSVFAFIGFFINFLVGIWYLIAKDYHTFRLILRMMKHGN